MGHSIAIGLRHNNTRKAPTFKLATPLGSWEIDREDKQIPHKLCPKIKNNAEYECRAITGGVKANHAALA